MRGTSQSAPEHSLQKTVPFIAFRIALTIDVKIFLFCCQVAVWVKKQPKNAIVGCSRFQKLNFNCLLLKL